MERAQQPRDEPIISVAGDKVALGPLRRDLVPLYQRWRNDLAIMLTWARPEVIDRDNSERWYEYYTKGEPRGPITFPIYERATSRPIGVSFLFDVDHYSRTAGFSLAIGEKDCWGKGYGTEATRLMLDYGFTALGLYNIWLSTDPHNARAIRAYRRAGFKEIGRRRGAQRYAGRPYDVLYMDCIAPEFASPVLHALMPEGEADSESQRRPQDRV